MNINFNLINIHSLRMPCRKCYIEVAIAPPLVLVMQPEISYPCRPFAGTTIISYIA